MIKRHAPRLTLLLVMALAVAGCSRQFVSGSEPPPVPQSAAFSLYPGTPVTAPAGSLTQKSSSGPVTIEVTWEGIKSDGLIFNVVMDTHSTDLDGYDLGKLAIMRDDAGAEYRPLSWDSPPGGHHRKGKLVLPVPESLTSARYVEIIIRDVGEVEQRTLRWNLPSS